MKSLRGVLLVFALAGCGSAPPVDSVDEAQRVCATGSVVKGVDVSHYDGVIDWAKVKAAGIEFAFMKATENTNFLDPEFATNWKNAGTNGVIRSAYHFFRPAADPIKQADYFLSVMGPSLPGDLPPTIDLEALDNLTGAQVTQAALQFLERVMQKTNRVPIVYTSARVMSLLGDPQGFTPYSLWVANWTTQCPNLPPAWQSWSFWQYSNAGSVDGIDSSELDVDQFNGTLSDLRGFAGGSGGDGDASDGDAGNAGASDGGEAADGGTDADIAAGHAPAEGLASGSGSGCSVVARADGRVDAFGPGLLLLALAVLATRGRGSPPHLSRAPYSFRDVSE